MPLAGGENILGDDAFAEALHDRILSVVQPDLAKWGGLTRCVPLGRKINRAGLLYCPHYLGGGIGLVASAHALAAAGGVLDGAETVGLNLAQKLVDGDQIVVGAADQSGGVSSSTTAGGTSPAATGESGGAGLVNLNTATEAELDELPGVGPVTAAAIISWRTSNEKFTDIEQLGEVDGIGPARLAKLRVLVSV